jgi:predicted SprT family Zn-dependent metalloprotease
VEKLKIPKEIYIFSQKIKVIWRRSLRDSHSAIGLSDFEKSVIYLQKSRKDYPISRDKIEQVFFHELAHFIFHYCGRDDLAIDERYHSLVDVVGSQLRQIVNQIK